jgi:hypothetical protein
MAFENQRQGPGAIFILAITAIIVVIVIAAVSLWQADNSATNALSGDPQSTSPPSPQVAP